MSVLTALLEEVAKKTGEERVAALRALLPQKKTEGWQHAALQKFFVVDRRLLLPDPATSPKEDYGRHADIVLWNGRQLSNADQGSRDFTVGISDLTTVPTTFFGQVLADLVPVVEVRFHRSGTFRLHAVLEALVPSVSLNVVKFVVDAGQRVIVEREQLASNAESHLWMEHTEVEVSSGASFEIHELRQGHQAIRSLEVSVREEGTFRRFTTGSMDGQLRDDTSVHLAASANAELYALALQQQDSSSFWSQITHTGPKAKSQQVYRSSVFAGAQVSVDMGARVLPEAAGTEAIQESRHLLLAPKAKAFTVPRLVIDTDDVQCRHGATVGHADTEQLQYMRARGIGDQRAKSLFAYGHLATLLALYPVSMRTHLDKELRTHLLLS